LQKVADSADSEDKAPTASQEFADAVTKFRTAVDAVQAAAPEDKSTAVQNLVDAARDKHEPVLDQVQEKVTNASAKDAIERAKDEESKDTEGEKKDKKFHTVETQYGSFVRSFSLPENADAEKINAKYNNGILELTIPKDEKKALKQTIKVN